MFASVRLPDQRGIRSPRETRTFRSRRKFFSEVFEGLGGVIALARTQTFRTVSFARESPNSGKRDGEF